MLVIVMLAAVSASGPSGAAIAPPIIVTTKSSPLCTAVRDIVAPTIAGLVVQDAMIQRGNDLMHDMTIRGSDFFTLDNVHLGNDVYHLAANNIKIHQALDELDQLKLSDPRAAADMAQLRAKLERVADGQAATLNLMSGLAQGNDLADIARVGNEQAGAIGGDRGAFGNPPLEGASLGPLSTPVKPHSVAGLIALYETATQTNEGELMPSLLPIINRCR